MSDVEYVLVRGVVYRRAGAERFGDEAKWWRCSVPPDGAPGKRSKWPPRYAASKLPAHEPIDGERARQIQESSLKRLEQLYAEGGAS